MKKGMLVLFSFFFLGMAENRNCFSVLHERVFFQLRSSESGFRALNFSTISAAELKLKEIEASGALTNHLSIVSLYYSIRAFEVFPIDYGVEQVRVSTPFLTYDLAKDFVEKLVNPSRVPTWVSVDRRPIRYVELKSEHPAISRQDLDSEYAKLLNSGFVPLVK